VPGACGDATIEPGAGVAGEASTGGTAARIRSTRSVSRARRGPRAWSGGASVAGSELLPMASRAMVVVRPPRAPAVIAATPAPCTIAAISTGDSATVGVAPGERSGERSMGWDPLAMSTRIGVAGSAVTIAARALSTIASISTGFS
jgi:hypothetical protein